jgi:Leucine-rich repeat (LRR) protein
MVFSKMKFYQWVILLVWLSANSTQAATDCNAVTEIPVSECQSLLEFYNSTGGTKWKNKTGWNETNTPCSWFGVTCSGDARHFNLPPKLTELNLAKNQLSGSIPNLNLPNLTRLLLDENQLSGSIPNFNLPNLTELFLSGNQLSGSIPNFNLPNLTRLLLAKNQLSGSIPNLNLPNLVVVQNIVIRYI